MDINNTTAAGAGAMAGAITNSGGITVAAHASGGSSVASATGIHLLSGPAMLRIVNSGSISVEAAVGNGGAASARGIRAIGNGMAGAPTDVLTIENSGDIIVRFSTDGGTAFHRGTAIDVTEAPNPTVINLLAGNITGDINLQSDADTINVTDDETVFNGIINASCMPAAGVAAGTGGGAADSPALSSCGVGTLNINNGGNFHLAIDDVDGPSYVFMNTLDLRAPVVVAPATSRPARSPSIFRERSAARFRWAPIRRCSWTMRSSTARWSRTWRRGHCSTPRSTRT